MVEGQHQPLRRSRRRITTTRRAEPRSRPCQHAHRHLYCELPNPARCEERGVIGGLFNFFKIAKRRGAQKIEIKKKPTIARTYR